MGLRPCDIGTLRTGLDPAKQQVMLPRVFFKSLTAFMVGLLRRLENNQTVLRIVHVQTPAFFRGSLRAKSQMIGLEIEPK